jgi:hypothetical protein
MTDVTQSPALLLLSVLVLTCACLVALTWGRKLPRQADWLVGLGILALFVAGVIGGLRLSEQGFAPEAWSRGWILPHDEPGAITVGVLRDALACGFVVLVSIVSACALIAGGGPARDPRSGRFHAAMGLGAGGTALAWLALTPWLALTGGALAVFGGFLALGARWDGEDEASIAVRFGYERSWGLLLSLLGLCMLAGERAPLTLQHVAGGWAAGDGGTAVMLGAALLFFGTAIQLQPFPLLGWVMRESETRCSTRIVISQVLTAWAAFALFTRLEPQFRDMGLFPVLGWLGLVSSALASLAGVFSSSWRLGLGAWLSAGFSLAVAALAFAGPSSGFCVLVGAGLGAAALANFGTALESGGAAPSPVASWAKFGCAISAAAGTGFAGFVASGGFSRMVTQMWLQPALVGTGAVILFAYVFLGWKVAWQAIASPPASTAPAGLSWVEALASLALVLVSLGLFWSGTLSGGAIPGDPDRVMHSLLTAFFGPGADAWGEEAAIGPSVGVYWAVQVAAIVAAYVTTGRKPEFWPGVSRRVPRFSAFVSSGYGIDAVFMRLRAGLSWLGAASVRLLDRKIWNAWFPEIVGRVARRGAALFAAADLRLSRGLGEAVRAWVESPAKALQLIQNGDVQWYLFFAVGSGLAILAYFMKTV